LTESIKLKALVADAYNNEDESQNQEMFHGLQEYEIQQKMSDPIAFAASSDPDIMSLREALQQPYCIHFLRAMEQEMRNHTERGH
jgi:hypothetical protein